jgi:hypothetical protein
VPAEFRVIAMTQFPFHAGAISLPRFAAIAAGLAVAACASGGGQATGRHEGAGSAAPVSPRVSAAAGAAARGLHGELAFVARGRLFLLGGPARLPRLVALPGIPFAPAWSADHRWLAVEVSKAPPPGSPAYRHRQEPAALWLVNPAGRNTRRLTPSSWNITGFAWSPRARQLAVTAFVAGAKPADSGVVAAITPAGRPKVLAVGSYVSGVAWSPRGLRVAAGVSVFLRGSGWHSTLESLNPAAGRPKVVAASTGSVLELAGWWPDGSGLLYWFDPQGSGSIAADGLPLDNVSLATGRSRQLVRSMLVHGSWLAFSPGGHIAAVVAGGDRVIWGGHKHIVLCRSSGRCTPVTGPGGVVALQPSWSPDGRTVAFTRTSAAGPFGPGGHADFSPSWITRWQATSRIWVTASDGSGTWRLAAAGPGALNPVWGRAGAILFVRANWLWLLPARATAPKRLAGPLGALAAPAYNRSYYGYIPYPQLIAWTSARPFATASNS